MSAAAYRGLGYKERVVKLLYGKAKVPMQSHNAGGPSLPRLLATAPTHNLHALVGRAHLSGELDDKCISQALRVLTQYKRYDKAQRLCRSVVEWRTMKERHVLAVAMRAAQKDLSSGDTAPAAPGQDPPPPTAEVTPPPPMSRATALRLAHRTALMSLATKAGHWREACTVWGDMNADGVRPNGVAYGALFGALRAGQQWRLALEHYKVAVEEEAGVDARGVHTLMHMTRKLGRWDLSCALFSATVSTSTEPAPASGAAPEKGSAGAPKDGVSPDYVLYKELLYTFEEAARSLPGSWLWSLAVHRALTAPTSPLPQTAGLYNTAMRTVADAGRWHTVAGLFAEMTAAHVPANADTFDVLAASNARSVDHVKAVMNLAAMDGVPPTADHHRMLFAALFRAGRTAEAMQVCQQAVRRAMDDPGNSSLRLGPLYAGMLDALAAHPRPAAALAAAAELRPRLEPALVTATSGLAAWGDSAERWTAEGRVAVLDLSGLTSPLLLSLDAHYDAVLVPYATVRRAVRAVASSSAAGPQRPILEAGLANLRRRLAAQPSGSTLAGTPLGGFGGASAGGTRTRVLPYAHQLQAAAELLSTFPVLGDGARPAAPLLEAPVVETPVVRARCGAAPTGDVWALPVDEPRTPEASPAAQMAPVAQVAPLSPRHAPHQALAVALMLQRLNPDAAVHLLTTDRRLQGLARERGITAVAPSAEALHAAAPPRPAW